MKRGKERIEDLRLQIADLRRMIKKLAYGRADGKRECISFERKGL